MEVPLLHVPFEDWYCPNCGLSERVQSLPYGATRFHTCPRLHSLTAPLVRTGSDCKVVAEDRQDYLGKEVVNLGDDGRAYMSVRTVHADGHDDLAVNAPVAQGRLGNW